MCFDISGKGIQEEEEATKSSRPRSPMSFVCFLDWPPPFTTNLRNFVQIQTKVNFLKFKGIQGLLCRKIVINKFTICRYLKMSNQYVLCMLCNKDPYPYTAKIVFGHEKLCKMLSICTGNTVSIQLHFTTSVL